MRRTTPALLALPALVACSGGGAGREDCASVLRGALDAIADRWPTAGAAREEPYSDDCVWYWSHKKASVEGAGVTMVTLEAEPNLSSAWDLPGDEHARGPLTAPSLLFFDQEGDDWQDWPLIGVGYHFDFYPCRDPGLQCAESQDWFIHEAGYHRSLLGDGGMDVATDADLTNGGSVDEAGCEQIDADDLSRRLGTIRHGRHWVTHLWIPPGRGQEPAFAVGDPWERWRDATDSLVIEGAFFYQDRDACGCEEGG